MNKKLTLLTSLLLIQPVTTFCAQAPNTEAELPAGKGTWFKAGDGTKV